jgi:hypothetical protein
MVDYEAKRLHLLSIGVCILSRVYQLNIRTPPYATNVSACFIVCALSTLHVSALISGHLQVICNTKYI